MPCLGSWEVECNTFLPVVGIWEVGSGPKKPLQHDIQHFVMPNMQDFPALLLFFGLVLRQEMGSWRRFDRIGALIVVLHFGLRHLCCLWARLVRLSQLRFM